MAPQPGRFELATRLAIICALTVLVVEIYQTPDAALTVYVVFFLNRDNRTISLILNVILLALITVIIGFVLLVAMVVINDPMWRVISMTAISIAILFVASASKLSPLGGTIALIVGYALDLLGTIPLSIGELATRSLLYAWLFVGIPAGISMIVNLLLAPPPRRLAERAIALWPRTFGRHAEDAERKHPVRVQRAPAGRHGRNSKTPWLGRPRENLEAGRHCGASACRRFHDPLMSAIDVIDRRPEAQLSIPIGRLSGSHAAGYVQHFREPADTRFGSAGTLRKCERAPTPLEADILGDIKEAIIHFAEVPSSEHQAKEAKKEGGGFFVADAFTNPDYIHYALKTTAAAMFCYFLYSLLDWPGIHTCFLTVYIVSLGTAAEIRGKAHAAYSRLPCRGGGRLWGDDLPDPGPHFDHRPDGRCFCWRFGFWLCFRRERAHILCRLSDGLCFLSLRHSGAFTGLRPFHRARSRYRHLARQRRRLSGLYQCLAGQRRQAHRSGNCLAVASARCPDDRG